MMHRIGIVPEDAEILCRGLQVRKPSHSLIGIGIALGIGILGHTPDPFDALVLRHKLFHHVHVGTLGRHGHKNHLNAEMLRDGKMSVVTGHRTQKFHLLQSAPGRTSHNPVGHGAGNGIIHNIQAGVAVYNHIFRTDTHDVCHHMLCLNQAVQNAVIADIHALLTFHVGSGVQDIKDIHPHVQLGHGRFAPGHIQFQSLSLRIFKFFLQPCLT